MDQYGQCNEILLSKLSSIACPVAMNKYWKIQSSYIPVKEVEPAGLDISLNSSRASGAIAAATCRDE